MSAGEGDYRPQNLSDLRMIFSRNLEELVGREKSVSECARQLRISRSQLNRFLGGDTYPRPDVLQRICQHFGTDARILTTSLAELSEKSAAPTEGAILPDLVEGLEPVPHSILPDGIYSEWMLSTVERGLVEQNLIRIYTQNGRRLGKIRASLESAFPGMKRYRYPMVICTVQYFMQREGFASIDRVARQSFHAFTAFRAGYGPSSNVYPGYKLSGISHNPKRLFARSPCLLQLVPNDTGSLLAASREPELRPLSQAPVFVQRILKEIQEESSVWQPV